MSISSFSFFISFEGIDGCGKSTQVKMLMEKFKKEKIKSILVREPGGTLISEKIRAILLDRNMNNMNYRTEAFLMIASRAQLTKEVVIPKLKEGYIVVADRYKDSTLAYQGAGRNLDINILDRMNKFATYNLNPDITFLMDLSSKIAAKRQGNINLDRIEKIGDNFQEKVRKQYLKLALDKANRFIVLDGTLSIETIHEIIWKNVKNKIK